MSTQRPDPNQVQAAVAGAIREHLGVNLIFGGAALIAMALHARSGN
jgi:hypothetical protein